MRVYISGPITGLLEAEYKEHFAKAESIIKAIGHEPVNPLHNGLEATADYKEHLSVDIANLLQCDAILMLYDWYYSRGARIELNVAHEMGLKIFYSFAALSHYKESAHE